MVCKVQSPTRAAIRARVLVGLGHDETCQDIEDILVLVERLTPSLQAKDESAVSWLVKSKDECFA